MLQIFMLIMLYVAVISGPLIGGVGAGYKAVRKWNADRGARTRSAHAVAPRRGALIEPTRRPQPSRVAGQA